jgi:hypothetical protein
MTRTLPPRPSAGNSEPTEPTSLLSAYRSTALLDRLRATEYSYLDAGGHVYLDYAGAGLPAQAQLDSHADRMRGRCFGNPHSENPASAASTELIERARLAVLAHFNAPPEEYAAIFTPNATGACRLVGEAYPFGFARRPPSSVCSAYGYWSMRTGPCSAIGPRWAARSRTSSGSPTRTPWSPSARTAGTATRITSRFPS